MAAFNGNNSLRLEAHQSGTLTFDVTQQTSYDSLFILATGGSGGPNLDYTINFSDATTTTGLISLDDWGSCSGGCTSYAINSLNRIDRTTGNVQGSNIFAIFEYPIILSAGDQAKQIVSIDFAVPSGEPGAANIFGITGYMPVSLPVTLEYFNVSAVNGKDLLQWKTSKEFNNSKFIVERASSANPTSFVEVGEINATGSATGSTYTFTNDAGVSGTYLYRLMQTDIDGNIKILGTKSISFNTKIKWLIQDLGTQWQLISPGAFIYRLIDMNGRILQAATGTGSATISKPVAHGKYEIQVQTGGEFSTQKLIK